MKIRSLVLWWSLAASSSLIAAVSACSSSQSDGVASLDASVDQATQQADIDDSNEIPCEPRRVLQAVCQQCHTRPPQNGAPFPLQRLSDVRTVRDGEMTRDDMIEQLKTGRMPLSPVTISDADKTTLLAWLESGATAVAATSCTDGGGDATLDAPDGRDLDAGSDAGDAQSDADAM